MANSVFLFQSDMPPLVFQLAEIRPSGRSWHKTLEITYLCRGSLTLWVNGQTYRLHEDQVFLINPYEIHRVSESSAVAAIFRLDLEAMHRTAALAQVPGFQNQIADLNSSPNGRHLKQLLARIIRTSTPQNIRTETLDYLSNACALLAHLMNWYPAEKAARAPNPHEAALLDAMRYLTVHFREPLSVSDAAGAAGFSVSYFSKLFAQMMGCSFLDYLTELRLAEARSLLPNPALSLEAVAEQSGFGDVRALGRAFRLAYGSTPGRFRREMSAASAHAAPVQENAGALAVLGDCLDELTSEPVSLTRTENLLLADVSAAQSGVPFRHSWQKSIGIGNAAGLLYAANQEMLRTLQKEIRFERVVLHGLLDDAMQVVSTDSDGNPVFSFAAVDMLLDFLLSLGLTPLLQLGYMPRVLARSTDNVINYNKSILSLPRDPEAWRLLITRLFAHLFYRYGRETVEGWEVCLWSKPDAALLPFGRTEFDEYFRFYRLTYEAVKASSPRLCFGSPAFSGSAAADTHWIEPFFARCRKEHCLPDRIRFDCYPVVDIETRPTDLSERKWMRYKISENAMAESLSAMQACIGRLGLPYGKPELEEWNLSISQRELLNDTCYKASFVVKTALDCWDKTDDMAYWALYDNMGESNLSDELFHGGLGLFSAARVKKAPYYAMQFLSQLGNTLLAQGPGYAVTRLGGNFQILLYNYCHFSALYADGESFDMTFTNRYTPFVSQRNRRYEFALRDLSASAYTVTQYSIDREHGSVYDQWIRMGAMPLTTREETDYLIGVSQPFLTKRMRTPENGKLAFREELRPFEVRLLTVEVSRQPE